MDEAATRVVLLTAGVVVVGLLFVALPTFYLYRAWKEKRMLAVFAAHMRESERQGRGAEEWAAGKALHRHALNSQLERGGAGAVYASYLLGAELFHEGKKEEASSLLLSAAQAGLPQAQLLLANLYFSNGRTEDEASSALVWFYFAAEQGIPEAQGALGYCYAKGRGAEADQTKGYKWLRLASLARDEAFPTSLEALQLAESLKAHRALWREDSASLRSKLTSAQISLADTWIAAWEPKTWQDLSIALRIKNVAVPPISRGEQVQAEAIQRASSPRSMRKTEPEQEPLTCRICGLINEASASNCDCGCPLP